MSYFKASRVGVKTLAKRLAGLPLLPAIRQSWQWDADTLDDFQRSQFTALVGYARARVPYYRDAWGQSARGMSKHPTVAELLSQLPILTKPSVRANSAQLIADQRMGPTLINTTSGTSGTPLRLAASVPELVRGQAVYDEWLHRRTGVMWPRTLFVTGFVTPKDSEDLVWQDHVTRSAYLSIYSLKPENAGKIAQVIDDLRPDCIAGYGSSVNELARLFEGGGHPRRAAITAVLTSEVLQPEWRERIKRNLAARVFDYYGSQEAAHGVGECPAGQMHVNPLVGIVELLDETGHPVPEGQVGRVVVTGLIRRRMPLIRYDIGDRAESTGFRQDCPCGLAWPTIGAVQGRSEDLVRTRDGRLVGYLCFHATKELTGIVEAQLIQHGYELFSMLIVRGEEYDECSAEARIRSEVESRLGVAAGIEFRYVDRIARGPNGKFKAVEVRWKEPDGSL